MGSYSTQSLDKYKYKYKSKCSKSRPATASTLIEANSMDSWTKSEWQYLKDEGRWQYIVFNMFSIIYQNGVTIL